MKTALLLIHLPLTLAVWNNRDHNFKIPKKTRGTGRTSTARPGATTRTLFYFEGVDYDLLPPNLHKKNNDCHAHFVWCIQNQTLMNTICAYSFDSGNLETYYSACEVELQNCRYRLKRKRPQKGDDMRNDLLYYNGEGYKCWEYARMGSDPVAEYFKTDESRRNADHKKLVFDSIPYKVLI